MCELFGLYCNIYRTLALVVIEVHGLVLTGVKSVIKSFPDMKILTSEVHAIAPNHFGQKYFGTD